MPRRPSSLQSGESSELRPEPRLLRAVEADDIVKVRDVFNDARDSRHFRNLLHIGLARACDKDHAGIANFLLAQGADPNYVTKDKQPGLLRAAQSGQVTIVAALLDHHAKIEACDKKGRTALMTAAWQGHFEIVKLLLQRGAHIDTVDYRRRNALHNVAADKGDDASQARPSNRTRWRCGLDVVEYLLQAGINLDAEDELGRTALHWACVSDNGELVKVLLTTRFGGAAPQARCNATDSRMKTPLHLAVSHDRTQLVQVLLAHGADVHARSDGGWTALHNACQSGSPSLVQTLVDSGADINSELLNGRTPLHVAAEFGNYHAAESLIAQTGLKRGVKDRFGMTPLLMAAQHGKKAIAEMLAPWNHIEDLSEDEKEAAKQFWATIVDFGNFRNENRVMKRTVYELLYARDDRDPSKHLISTMPKNIKATNFRWIHLPANNLAWCDALLTKRFIEEGATDIEGYKALESSFGHQHRGQKHHSRFMRPMCQVVQRTPPEHDDSESGPEVIVEEPDKLTPIPDTPAPKNVVPSSGASKRGKPKDKTPNRNDPQPNDPQTVVGAGPSKPFHEPAKSGGQPARQGTTDTAATGVVSEASIGSSQNGKPIKGSAKRQETISTIATSTSDGSKRSGKQTITSIKAPKNVRKDSPRHPRGSLDKSPSKRSLASSCNIFMFMPYLHFETDRRRKEMRQAMENPERLMEQTFTAVADEVLIRAHLTKSSSFLHVRRTLDQFFYHNIDTETRDCDQVVDRFQRKHRKSQADVDPKIFMVDQLWMWILGKDLVVTSFPQRWRQPRNDPLNVLEGIIEDINSKTRDPVTSVYELAQAISGRCFGTFDRHRKGDEDFQFLDMFESSIGAAMDEEAGLFQDFSSASRQASAWLRSHQRPTRFSKALEAESKALEHAAKRSHSQGESVKVDEPPDTEPQFVDKLLDVGSETDLLAEIKDIRDELDIIRMVLGHQQHLLPDLQKAITNVYKDERSYAQERKVNRVFEEQEKIISNPLKDIGRMDKQAERIYEAIRDLLDLKQKHANAFEARFARDQAAGTQRQGQTIMVFTIVTVIFLPLSFVAAFFAINIEQFPHPPSANGQQMMSLRYVSAYVFGIGIAISVPCIAIALSLDQINQVVIDAKRYFNRSQKDKNGDDEEDDDDGITASKIKETFSLAKTMRRSVEVRFQDKMRSPTRSMESRYGGNGNAYLRASRPSWDLERGRRNARTDTQ